jgi:predicted transcriptional regulator
MEDALPVLAGDIPVGAAITLLQHCQAVLVQEHGAISGIVTNVDVGRVFSLQGR